MDNQISHLEQYKMLREEIMHYAKEMQRTELATAIAVGAIYTWLLLNKQNIPSRAVWFIAPLLILASASRCLTLMIQIKFIAGYLKRIEEAAFGEDTKLPGWERYIYERSSNRSFRKISFMASAGVWAFLFIFSIVVSWLSSR